MLSQVHLPMFVAPLPAADEGDENAIFEEGRAIKKASTRRVAPDCFSPNRSKTLTVDGDLAKDDVFDRGLLLFPRARLEVCDLHNGSHTT